MLMATDTMAVSLRDMGVRCKSIVSTSVPCLRLYASANVLKAGCSFHGAVSLPRRQPIPWLYGLAQTAVRL